MIDKNSDIWRNLPIWVKWWFFFNYGTFRPSRKATQRGILISHISGFLFCALGLVVEGALPGGLAMLFIGYFFYFMRLQGDHYGVWYDLPPVEAGTQ